jgi:predicted TPR repeat methyltransferase
MNQSTHDPAESEIQRPREPQEQHQARGAVSLRKCEDPIEAAGAKYAAMMMDDEDVISSRVYRYQIARRNQMLARELVELQPRVALDLGCGVGFHSLTIDQYTREKVLLSDLSQNALSAAEGLNFRN